MTNVNRGQTVRELVEAANLQVGFDEIPTKLASSIVPVIEVNPKLLKRCDVVEGTGQTTSGTKTVYTTPSGKDFYLVSCAIGIVKDVTCDISSGGFVMSVTVNNVSKQVLGIPIITTTAERETASISFPVPIKLDRGTTITFSGTFTTGACIRTGNIIGYTVD